MNYEIVLLLNHYTYCNLSKEEKSSEYADLVLKIDDRTKTIIVVKNRGTFGNAIDYIQEMLKKDYTVMQRR